MPIHTDVIRAFLARWETRQAVAYIPCRKRNYTGSRAYAPALYGEVIGVSGVTVGTGLDLGQQAEADLCRIGHPGGSRFPLSPLSPASEDGCGAGIAVRASGAFRRRV